MVPKRDFLHEILLAIGLFLATMATSELTKMGDRIENIRLSLSQLAEKLIQHEGRIYQLESEKGDHHYEQKPIR